jgi:hypothetical protein
MAVLSRRLSAPVLGQVRTALTPKGAHPRRLRFGLARGAVANVDLRFDAAFFFGLHERPLHQHYRRLVKRGTRVFDVGMYRGWDALTFAWMTGAEVVSFDGNPKMLEQAGSLIAPSGLERITLVNSYVSDGTSGLSLDTACATYFRPEFVKMDIEGAEAAALSGAGRLLSEVRPAMVIETHGLDVENACLDILRGHGYGITIVDQPPGLLKERRPIEHNRWLVCEPGAASR